MKTLIAYSSKHGCTETCTRLLSDCLEGEVERVNLKEESEVNLSTYDTVVIGSPIYAGRILDDVRSFTEENMDALMQKNLGLFICGMQEEHTIREELELNYPAVLRKAAVVTDCFGGEYHFDTMNFMEKMIIKKVAKVKEDVSDIREETIQEFADKLNAVEPISS
ncbi:MAG: flavodoxin domain-containing protein [Alkalibacterium sp.]|nr:flavodoxin domain-containing protein [Alkalibacterium sp.]